eukprot:GHVO01068501.1.p1 GENE.GHVO01068501.1~~GHVO01068501.1.p1  ORF type:complete len:183 (+),score=31.72 GHVO01068501.1:171-719(+)
MTSTVDRENAGPRSIPKCVVIADTADHIVEDKGVGGLLQDLQDLHGKYSFMEKSLRTELSEIDARVPELRDAIGVVESLKKLEEEDQGCIDTIHKLADNVFVKAKVTKPKEVYLWLGADTFLSYSFDGALELLNKNLKTAETSVEKLDKEVDFVRTQIVTTELNLATAQNHAIRLRSAASAK